LVVVREVVLAELVEVARAVAIEVVVAVTEVAGEVDKSETLRAAETHV
jgi:hypothetical protein